ncbi:MAG: hypothetical protein JXA30_16160 [Deltaproteobacteria bacterium]|nr:hypothetical protein [Deltaproteobacteria bacterium]
MDSRNIRYSKTEALYSFLRRTGLLISITALGFFLLGRWSSPSIPLLSASDVTKAIDQNKAFAKSPISQLFGSSTINPRLLPPFRDPPAEKRENSAENNYRKEQARSFVGLIWDDIEPYLDLEEYGLSAESIANQRYDYIRGLAASIVLASPEIIEDVSEEIERNLCRDDIKDARLLALLRTAHYIPGVMTSEGIDCVIQRRSREDAVLISALDAWRISGLAKTEGIHAVETGTSNPYILGRISGIKPDSTQAAFASQTSSETNEQKERTADTVIDEIVANQKLGPPPDNSTESVLQ